VDTDIASWRRKQRIRLIAARQATPEAARHASGARIGALLEQAFAVPAGKVIAFCWPYRGEVDVRFAIRRWRAAGALAALPMVVAKAQPLQFRLWWPGVAMTPGDTALTRIPSARSALHACTPALPKGTLTTTCGSIVARSFPSRIMPATSVAITSALTGPCTIWQMRRVISRGSPASFAISDGLVVTPSMMPRAQ
jgi:hypothetical protein